MKCVFSVLSDDSFSVVIETDKAYVEYVDEVQYLDVSSRYCFNTLISLFSLKESWISEKSGNPFYKIEFINGEYKEEYVFKDKFPSNFSFFNAYIYKLVGDSI